MKMLPALLGGACALLAVGQAEAETWSQQITPKKPNDNVAIKVDRVKEGDLGEFLQFRVMVKMKDTKELPHHSGYLQIFNGKEFVSASDVQSTGPDGARVFSFRVSAGYAHKSIFSYSSYGHLDSIGYWFYLGDFVEAK